MGDAVDELISLMDTNEPTTSRLSAQHSVSEDVISAEATESQHGIRAQVLRKE